MLLPLAVTVTVILWVGTFIYAYIGPNSAIGRILISIGFEQTGGVHAFLLFGGPHPNPTLPVRLQDRRIFLPSAGFDEITAKLIDSQYGRRQPHQFGTHWSRGRVISTDDRLERPPRDRADRLRQKSPQLS